MMKNKTQEKEGWKVVETTAVNRTTGQEINFVNIMPCYGTEHKGSPDCWCEPDIEENGVLLIHFSDN